MKQALCCVCKGFQAIAQELIYEYLFLQDNHDWDSLAGGVEHSYELSKKLNPPAHGAGWYVRRMELSTRSWTQERGLAAARVLKCCPNVRVATFGSLESEGTMVGMPAELIRALFQSCARTLRSLDWTCDLGGVQTGLMLAFLHRCRELQSFFMCLHTDHAAIIRKVPQLVPYTCLPALHTFELISSDVDPSALLRLLGGWDLPSIRQVVLSGQLTLSDAWTFFAAHGKKLRTLEFDYAGEALPPVNANGEAIMDLGDDGLPLRGPAMLFARCPNLDELVLHMHWVAAQATPGHPRVSRIGVRGLVLLSVRAAARAPQRGVVQHLGAAFRALLQEGRFPKLKVVRLLDFDQASFQSLRWRTSSVTFWAFWVKRFEVRNIRLEDHAGELVRIVFSEMNVLLPEDEVTNKAPEEATNLSETDLDDDFDAFLNAPWFPHGS